MNFSKNMYALSGGKVGMKHSRVFLYSQFSPIIKTKRRKEFQFRFNHYKFECDNFNLNGIIKQ